MKFLSTELPDVLVIEPDVHRDPRGFFLESYHLQKYREGGISVSFVQDNHSYSIRGTIRGLARPAPEAAGETAARRLRRDL
jgi:dTDP-4-dehydrorhamnose 3,5-epimerase